MSPIGVFGGTFDPIHYGHLRTAFELLRLLRLAEVRFVPAGDPPHRAVPLADADRRLAMVRVAIAGQPGFVVDDREVRRRGRSYTLTTIAELRGEFPSTPICLLIGMDAFIGLPDWHRWEEILPLTHIVVAHRPGWEMPLAGVLGDLLAERQIDDVAGLHAQPGGRVFIHPVTQLEISSTQLREIVRSGRDPRYLVPDAVRDMIRETGCYTSHHTR
jgi:nicotinate-nucleotide adenylyltransferase